MDTCVISVIGSDVIRERLNRVLEKLFPSGDKHLSVNSQLRWHRSLEDAAENIKSIYASPKLESVVLISDLLVEDGQPTSASCEIMDAHDDRPFATIAFTIDGFRVPEIHRTVRTNASDTELQRAIEISLDYLRYVSRPLRPQKQFQPRIRRLRTESELRDYYALRYRIYHIMGYLEPDVERAPTRLEIDACDEWALHLGAYDRKQGYEVLAGTARLVIGSADAQNLLGDDTATHTNNLIKSDPVLRSTINDRLLPLILPVFQSQELNQELTAIMINELNCGELSRVIVDEPYRGSGLSHQLVNRAIEVSRQFKLHKLFLECLKIHVPLYRSLGFAVIPNKRGRVTGVSKTMIPMQLDLRTPPAVVAASN